MQERLISWKYLAKKVFCFMKLISKEGNTQRIITPRKSMNKLAMNKLENVQTQVAITAIIFYFIFSYYLRSFDFHYFTQP